MFYPAWRRFGAVSYFLPCVFSCAAHAQTTASTTAASTLPTTFVTATRTTQDFSQLISDVSLIDTEELRDAGAYGVSDALRYVGGIQTTSTGTPGSQQSVFIRGANSTHTLGLVEGFRMGSVSAGLPSMEGLPASRFSHAEVLRGAASGLYGSDAIGGVVQLFLPRGQGAFKPQASLGWGHDNTRNADMQLSGGNDAFDASLGFGRVLSDGFSATNAKSSNFDPDRDAYDRSNFAGQFNFRPTAGHELGVVMLRDNLDYQFDSAGSVNDSGRLITQLIGVRGTHALNAVNTLKWRVGESRDKADTFSDYRNQMYSKQQQYGVDWDWQFTPAWQLSLGAEQLKKAAQRIDNFDGYYAEQRRNNALRLNLSGSMAAHLWQMNLRHDDDSSFGSEITGGVNYAYRFNPAWRWTVGYNTAFQAPNFNDLYFTPYNNPNLKPEHSKQVETGLYYAQAQYSAKAVLFQNRVRDLINSVAPDYLPQNIARAEITGLELTWQQRFGATTVDFSFDALNPRDQTNNKQLARRAQRTASARITHSIAAWNIGTQWQALSERFDDAANTTKLGGYSVFNLYADTKLTQQWQLFLRADNVLDKNYESAYGYNTPGFGAFAGVRYLP